MEHGGTRKMMTIEEKLELLKKLKELGATKIELREGGDLSVEFGPDIDSLFQPNSKDDNEPLDEEPSTEELLLYSA